MNTDRSLRDELLNHSLAFHRRNAGGRKLSATAGVVSKRSSERGLAAHSRRKLTTAAMIAVIVAAPIAAAPPEDPEVRAASTLAQMTQDEKLSMLQGFVVRFETINSAVISAALPPAAMDTCRYVRSYQCSFSTRRAK